MYFRCRRKLYGNLVFGGLLILSLLVLLFFHQVSSTRNQLVDFSKQFVGVRYCYGGQTPDGFDCSGFVMFLFHRFGRELPRTADKQAQIGQKVGACHLLPGHVLFFATEGEETISHCGLYIGNGQFIHASAAAGKIIISTLDNPYWRQAFREAREILIEGE